MVVGAYNTYAICGSRYYGEKEGFRVSLGILSYAGNDGTLGVYLVPKRISGDRQSYELAA